MSKKITKTLSILALLLIGVVAFYWGQRSKQGDISTRLSKQIYNRGEEVRLTIRNNTFQQACFSSCYPYYLQKKNEEWSFYNYPNCPDQDSNLPCISPGEKKTFSFDLEKKIESGIHRIAIPINKKGKKGEEFAEDKKVYSDPFDVK